MTRPTPCQKCKAERDELAARVTELEQHDRLVQRARELETADLAALTAKLDKAENLIEVHVMSARDMNRQLAEEQARVRELEAERDELRRACDDYFELTDDLAPPDMLVHWRQDRQKLADANALLGQLPARMRELMDRGLRDAIDAHLAAQPAAPSSDAVLGRMARLVAWNFVTSQPSVMPFDLLKFAALVQSHVNQQPAAPECTNTEAFLSGGNTGCDGVDCPVHTHGALAAPSRTECGCMAGLTPDGQCNNGPRCPLFATAADTIECMGCGCAHPPGGHMVAGVFMPTPRAATCCEYHRTGGSPSNPCQEAVTW